MKSGFTVIVRHVDVRFRLDELFHHAFYGQPGSQNERGGAVKSLGIQISRPVLEEDVKDTLGICGYGGM